MYNKNFKEKTQEHIFTYLVALIQPPHASPGAGGKKTGMFAELSSSMTSRLIQDERRLNPLWKIWIGADAHAAETLL